MLVLFFRFSCFGKYLILCHLLKLSESDTGDFKMPDAKGYLVHPSWARGRDKMPVSEKTWIFKINSFWWDSLFADITLQEVKSALLMTHARPWYSAGIYLIENFPGSTHLALNYSKEPIEKTVITVWLKISPWVSSEEGFFPPLFSVCIHLSACLDCNCIVFLFFQAYT